MILTRHRASVITVCCVLLCIISYRLIAFYYHDSINHALFSSHSVRRVVGCVHSLIHCSTRRCGFDFTLHRVDGQPFKGRIHVFAYAKKIPFRESTCWEFSFKSYQANAFSMRERLWSQNLYAKGTVLFKFPVIQRSHLQAYDPWLHWRSSVEQLILSSVSAPSVQASLSALTIGARNLLSSHDWRVYQRTGTSHLVAVSGLHCGIVYSLSYWLVLRVLVFFFCIRQVAMTPQITRLIALVLTYLYACLVGMSVPTQRAWLMLMWAGVPGFFCIDTPVWRRIISAMVVIIFLEPGAVFKAGFWLSFSAVIWLAYVLRARIGALSAWQEFFRVSLAVNIGLLPLSMYYFHQFSLIAFLINILAVPWVTLLIVPGCVLATVMSFFSISCAHFLFHFVAFLFIPLWSILSWCADYHWVVIYTGSISLWRVVIASFGLVVFLSPLSWVVRLSSLGFLSLVI